MKIMTDFLLFFNRLIGTLGIDLLGVANNLVGCSINIFVHMGWMVLSHLLVQSDKMSYIFQMVLIMPNIIIFKFRQFKKEIILMLVRFNFQLNLIYLFTGIFLSIEVRQIKYLNNIIEQDHRHIKKIIKPMMGFKSFYSATATIAGMELHHMLRKRQHLQSQFQTIHEQFNGLAA